MDSSNCEENVTTVLREYKHGAFISLNSTDLTRFNNIGMNTSGTLSIKKSKSSIQCRFCNIKY